ncbi:hypothetical protein CSKR_200450 [Clonorchis sinensis]|uniref:Uncharacterized protein n=1 Tax=Clonorchis sinensis TaxID=79923 RepID=A0A8T1MD07_CLOSI|nr:hypothetical protein CSKR_200450 [Clonorchis sinensis]
MSFFVEGVTSKAEKRSKFVYKTQGVNSGEKFYGCPVNVKNGNQFYFLQCEVSPRDQHRFLDGPNPPNSVCSLRNIGLRHLGSSVCSDAFLLNERCPHLLSHLVLLISRSWPNG